MKELIFSIEDIFNNDTPSGCLAQYDTVFYHIPSYQRGYKWSSDKNGGVTVLINDLWSAFNKSKETNKKEYYLQYITVKPIKTEKGKCLEVIDGQQRLTTLSVMLSVISSSLKQKNIAADKLDYAIRDNFFTEHIYNSSGLEKLIERSWDVLLLEGTEFNKQDIFYIHAAARRCSQTFSSTQFRSGLVDFYQFLLANVKLIVNSVESHIESEIVFRNLNSNKVPLTEAELIKGLLITKVGRQSENNNTKNFQEIIEVRSNIGRRWDELSSWANRPDISSFYFNNHSDAMGQLLKLSALLLEDDTHKLEKGTNSSDLPVFNFFLNREGFNESFETMLEIKNKLDNWFDKTIIYNLLGFSRYHKSSSNNKLSYLVILLRLKLKSDIKDFLVSKRNKLLNDLSLSKLSYSESSDEIHQILLSLNVFIQGQESIRFDFYNYEKQKWSLEHIFPQSPEGKKNVLGAEDKDAIIDLLGEDITDEVRNVLAKESRTDIEKEAYYKALQEHPALNSLGNMCLLTGEDNSSNGNKFFHEKRQNILNRIRQGSFVPRHTFDVFSKMFPQASIEHMKVWTITDIDGNLKHIEDSLNLKTK
jgi:hypothetical protein